MSRKALIVGIDYYNRLGRLHGCVSDAYSVSAALSRHADGTKNFAVKMVHAADEHQIVTRKALKNDIEELFSGGQEVELLYFAGHGFIDNVGGYIITSECQTGDDGVSLSDVIIMANNSTSRNRIVILDSCHSGYAGNSSVGSGQAVIDTGVTVLTASTEHQYAEEINGHGLFTSLFVDALNGAAANLVGDVTPGSIYSHIDQALGPWQQRPLFKTNVSTFTSLRRAVPPINPEVLRKIREYFESPSSEILLDPSYEPTSTRARKENTDKFSDLQAMVKVNLVRPHGEEHMYFAAMNNKSCRLTIVGEHYWRLLDSGQI